MLWHQCQWWSVVKLDEGKFRKILIICNPSIKCLFSAQRSDSMVAAEARRGISNHSGMNDDPISPPPRQMRPPSPSSMSDIAKRNIRVETHLQYRCRWCQRVFNRSVDCYRHFLKAHSVKEKKKRNGKGTQRVGDIRRPPVRGQRPPFHRHQPPLQGTDSCQFCGELPEMRVSASSASLGGRSGRLALKQHEECQHKFKDHRCLYCGKRFFYAVSLKAHVRGGHAGGSKGDLTT